MKKKVLAIITARGGSKRIPRKNIRLFLGRPLIEYSIDAALKSKIFSRVIVSTDDNEIAEISKKAGAEIPFMRTSKNSDDFATTVDVVKEVLDGLEGMGEYYEHICCLYPTAPFITPKKLIESYELLQNENTDTVIPITSFSFPIQRSFKIENNYLNWAWPEYMSTRSQDLEKFYHDAGQFYWFKNEHFQKTGKIFSERTTPYILEGNEVQDIDDLVDWKIAEAKYKAFIE
ncbi:MAG: pseudaminic acid cytidylyltransferase [Halobacteriovoraceae bacterium]|nr:pseudaminic acid cytidylyltransferase [Halobacteriovoraceae bacterium]